MAKIIINSETLTQLKELDYAVRLLNKRKIKLLFEELKIELSVVDLEQILDWNLIAVSVADRQMATQLNKLAEYIPNLIFVVETDAELFTVKPGQKKRRIRKDR